MTHISGLGAGIYSDLAVATPAVELTGAALSALNTAAGFAALFATEIANAGGTRAAGAFVRIKNIREYPSFGTPANIVNVPVYGQPTSSQVQGQSDSPSLETTLNYVAADWGADAATILAPMVGDGIQRAFRFTLLNSLPTGTGATQYASTTAGLGTVPNTCYYWVGKLEALVVKPALTDANQATLTLSIQGKFYGAFTNT